MTSDPDATRSRDDHAHVIAWPPLLFATVVLAGLAAHRVWPWPWFQLRSLAGALVLVACALAGWAGIAMTAAGTAIHPTHPTTAVVTGGPYRFTRNPMYVALCVLALAIGLWVGDGWTMCAPFVLGAVLHWGVIRREERYLEAKFGEPYRAFCRRVRRWI